MTTPPVPREELELASTLRIEALSKGCIDSGEHIGTGKKSIVTYICEKTTWSDTTTRRRLAAAKELGLLNDNTILKNDFTAPVLPSSDEDLDVTIDRLEAEQLRRDEYRRATEWMRFDVHGDAPFALAFVGDPHLNSCDIRRLRRHVDTIQTTPRMWAVGLGDWVDGWVGKLRGQYAHSTVTEKQSFALAQWLFGKENLWWALILGNHDGQRWWGEASPLRWMLNTAAVNTLQEWTCKFSISCGDRVWKVSAAHNFPGNSMYSALHGPKKRALFTGGEADIYVAGDRHVFGLQQDQHEFTGRTFWTLRARGYKYFDNYPLEHGHADAGGPNGIGHSVVAVFDPSDGTVNCFSDVERAASYLCYLQSNRN